jgi:hypothetical protein
VRAQVDRDLTTVDYFDRLLGLIKNLGRHMPSASTSIFGRVASWWGDRLLAPPPPPQNEEEHDEVHIRESDKGNGVGVALRAV